MDVVNFWQDSVALHESLLQVRWKNGKPQGCASIEKEQDLKSKIISGESMGEMEIKNEVKECQSILKQCVRYIKEDDIEVGNINLKSKSSFVRTNQVKEEKTPGLVKFGQYREQQG